MMSMSRRMQAAIAAALLIVCVSHVNCPANGAAIGTVVPSESPTFQSPSPAYILSPDDELTIAVLGHDELKQDVTILPDGTINYPVVGNVQAAGLTASMLQKRIIKGLTNLNQPQVTVTIRQSRKRQISILGAAKAVGQYDCIPGMHLLAAIAACGGAAQAPELTTLLLVTDSGRTSRRIAYSELLANPTQTNNPELLPGDIIIVEAKDASYAQVQVIGQVKAPGLYTVPPDGVSITSLLAQVGGPTETAALTHAEVHHNSSIQTVNLRDLTQNLDSAAGTLRLMPGDVLLVPENKAKVAIVGFVRAPGAYLIPDGETLSASKALAVSGGVLSEGDNSAAVIIRGDPSNPATGQQIRVDMEKLYKGDRTADAMLQQGDILYVPKRRNGTNAGNLFSGIGLFQLFKGLL